MYGYIYLTTNLVNGKMYIGQKKSEVFCEWYLGSGKILRRAVNKYGQENFKVEVLGWYNNKEDLDKAEVEEIRKRNAARSPEYYNIAIGGQTLVHYLTDEQRKLMSERQKVILNRPEVRKRMSDAQKGHKPTLGYTGHSHSEETRKKMSESHKAYYARTGRFHLSEEQKKKISDNHADMHGENNPMYGKTHSEYTRELIGSKCSQRNTGGRWMIKDNECSFVYQNRIEEYLNNGWIYGRIIHKRSYK